jgi:DNA polymerase-3 subunit epsilon
MDDWLAMMRVRMLARHDALADALATAQMLQVALAAADRVEMTCPAHLLEMQKAQHWLGKR